MTRCQGAGARRVPPTAHLQLNAFHGDSLAISGPDEPDPGVLELSMLQGGGLSKFQRLQRT